MLRNNTDVRSQVNRYYSPGGIICLGHAGALIGRAMCKSSGQNVAIKYIPITGQLKEIRKKQRKAAEQEASLLMALSHPNIVKCFETFSSRDEIVTVLEYCPGGDLLEYIMKRGAIDEDKAQFLFVSICSALLLCHKNRIAHRDIKLENILLRADGTPVLCDFGMSERYSSGQRFHTAAGSRPYMPPEMLLDEDSYFYNDDSDSDDEDADTDHQSTWRLNIHPEAADVFALGVVMYAVLKGKWPFAGETVSEWRDNLTRGDYDIGTDFSTALRELVAAMLRVDPQARPSFAQLMAHEWTQQSEDWGCEM